MSPIKFLLSLWLVPAFVFSFSSHSVLAALSKGCARKVKESIDHPLGWVKEVSAPADYVLEMRIGLPQPNFHVLESHLYEVSDPDHPRYGAHLSKEEVEALVAPHPQSVDLVNEWLSSHGFNEDDLVRSPAKDWVTIKVPVRIAEKMLDTKYHIWRHVESGDAAVRTTNYSLPEDLYSHIELIQPTTLFARLKALRSTLQWSHFQNIPENSSHDTLPAVLSKTSGTMVNASCNSTITITCLKQLYNAVGYSPSATSKNQLAITGYLEQYANRKDLQLFFRDQVPTAVNSTFKFVSIKGGINNQSKAAAGIEANLDTQFGLGLAYPTPATFYSTGGRPPVIPDTSEPDMNTNEPYLDWLNHMLSHPNPALTISTSYDDDEQTVPLSYARRVCHSFAQLGARGVSLLFSSGDGGVGDTNPDPTTQKCFTNHGKNITRYRPGFPSTCPFVTSVGGTTGIHETAASFSGGGFSDYFPRPAFQDAAVKKYLDRFPEDLYRGLFNRSGRAIPDVSAQAEGFRIFLTGRPGKVSGTSAACPTVAGFVSLLNDARISKKKPPLGFLNPLLYSRAFNAFNDITTGNNPGCGTPGFNATTGWDPVTGLGTPNFGKLKEMVLRI